MFHILHFKKLLFSCILCHTSRFPFTVSMLPKSNTESPRHFNHGRQQASCQTKHYKHIRRAIKTQKPIWPPMLTIMAIHIWFDFC